MHDEEVSNTDGNSLRSHYGISRILHLRSKTDKILVCHINTGPSAGQAYNAMFKTKGLIYFAVAKWGMATS